MNYNRPGTLCTLERGKHIAAHEGFVATFNWLVSCIENLKGEQTNYDEPHLEVLTLNNGTPVLALKNCGEGGVSSVAGTEGSASKVKTLTFKSASDSNVKINVTDDGDGNATVEIGVYYK